MSRWFCFLSVIFAGTASTLIAADPQIPYWSGRPAVDIKPTKPVSKATPKQAVDSVDQNPTDKTQLKPVDSKDPITDSNKVGVNKDAVNKDSSKKDDANKTLQKSDLEKQEPEWLRRMDQNDRSTLKGGWGLQNLSGGTQNFTTAGNRDGYFAPNTYQGAQFQQWNNVSNRQDLPSWNGTTQNFSQNMWSQGYVSPNNYFGGDAQRWGNMSAGGMSPNMWSGGWSMSPWP